jgi:hypothetical protein
MTIQITATGEITGYASLFAAPDHEADIIAPGAFDETLQELAKKGRSVPMLWQHEAREPIGLWTHFRTDKRGLLATGRLLIHDVARAREAHALAKAGAVTGLSIGFRPLEVRRQKESGTRLITRIRLYEVSLVTFPALEEARVSAVKKITTP